MTCGSWSGWGCSVNNLDRTIAMYGPGRVADIRRIAATELKGPRCWCGTPVLDWRAHRAWHEAGYPRE